MAYDFVAASSQYLSTASTPVTGVPLTIAAFGLPNTTAGLTIISVNKSSDNNRFTLTFATAGNISAIVGTPSGTTTASSSGSYTTGIYQHTASKHPSNASHWAALNGSFGSENTTSVTPSGVNVIYIGTRFSASLGNYMNGRIAEAAIWSAALTDEEVTSLSKGFKPYRIRPQSLVFYAPLIRNLQDTKGALAITNNNSATVAVHPRVI